MDVNYTGVFGMRNENVMERVCIKRDEINVKCIIISCLLLWY